MRTISENIQSMRDESVMDKISFFRVDRTNNDKKSCFYELGADRAASFGAFTTKSEPEWIQRIRNHNIK